MTNLRGQTTQSVLARDLTVRRGGQTVLDALSFEIERGSVTGLLGPSGCGKSTLMRAIVGVQTRVAGRLVVLGFKAGSARLRTRVGYATQAASVYDDLSIKQNVRYFASLLGLPAAEAKREGRMLAAMTPDELLQRAGTTDPEAAFLAVIEASEHAGTGRHMAAYPAEGEEP